MSGSGTWSIAELSAQSGVSVRTVRYYQTQALIPPPRRAGREVRYDDAHLAALRLIGELQERGLRLSTIRQVMARAREDPESLKGWLGLDASLSRPWAVDPPALCTRDQLTELVGGRDVATDALVEHGLVERRDDTRPTTYLVPSTRLLELCLTLVDLGVSAEASFAAHAILRDRLAGLADDLVRHVTDDIAVERRALDGMASLAELVDQLRPVAHAAVGLAFSHEMERALRDLARIIAELREADSVNLRPASEAPRATVIRLDDSVPAAGSTT